MAIHFDCPHCKAHYEVADDLGGKMIMCRECQKRAAVKSLAAAGTAASAALPSVAKSATPSRRNFLLIGSGVVASLGAIATGAILARQPWRHGGRPSARDESDRGPGRRRRPPPEEGAPPNPAPAPN